MTRDELFQLTGGMTMSAPVQPEGDFALMSQPADPHGSLYVNDFYF
jgi:hypothetical protein